MGPRAIGRLALRGLCPLLLGLSLSLDAAFTDDTTVSFELREAKPPSSSPPAVTGSPVRNLSSAETAKLLSRLPPIKRENPAQPVAAPEGSGPPAGVRSEAGVLQAATEVVPPTPAHPLRIVRHAPDGAVELAADLSVTFSEPMVPLASDEDLEQGAVPARLTPEPPGRWRWLDTSTLLFKPEGRFPMATSYSVEIPRGTRSLAGNALENDRRWAFTTPPPKVIAWHPKNGPTSDVPLVFVRFDQRVNPDEFLAKLRVRVAERDWAMRLATRDEVKADDTVQELIKDSLADRWVVLRPKNPFPAGAHVRLRLESGFGSAEGSLTTTEEQTHTFVVRSVLKFVNTAHGHGWASLLFSNPIDAKGFDTSWISVSPPVEGFTASVAGDLIVLGGSPRRPQKYRVRVARALRDVFGQTLQHDVSTKVATGKPWVFAGVWLAHSPLAAADPKHPSVSVFTRNLSSFRVRVYAVEPSSWSRFRSLVGEYNPKRTAEAQLDDIATLGPLVLDRTVSTSRAADTPVESRIDLTPCLARGNGRGHLVVSVSSEIPKARRFPLELARAARLPAWFDVAWVQVTQIGIEAAADGDSLLAWATSLVDGRPLADVEVELVPTGERATTNAAGLARLPLAKETVTMMLARTAGEVAVLPGPRYGGSWARQPLSPFRWYVVDDRGLYRPGEEVRLKGYLRQRDRQGTLLPLDPAITKVEYVLEDSRENKLLEGSCDVNRFGAFDLALTLPEVMTLGEARLRFDPRSRTASLDSYVHRLRVEEFRRPEYEVDLRSDGLVVAGDSIVMTSQAKYYTGSGLVGAKASWSAELDEWSRLEYTPEGWAAYTFTSDQELETESRKAAGLTNADGEHALLIATRSVGARVARPLEVSVSIEDLNGQSWEKRGWVTILPARALVGLKSERRLVPPGAAIDVDVAVVDPSGIPAAGRPVSVSVERSEWRQVGGIWGWQVLGTQKRELISAGSPVRTSFEPEGSGRHVISAVVVDAKGREHASEITVWVTGKGFAGTGEKPDLATVTPDKEEYAAGERAQIVVTSPFAPASGLLTLRRAGIVHSETFEMTGRTHTVVLAVDEAWMPGGELRVDLLSANARGSGPAPDHPLSQHALTASASASLVISRASRRLALTIVPQPAELAPGGEASLSLQVRDNAGRPVADAEVAVWGVDEAVLALLPRAFESPSEALNPEEYAEVSEASLFDHLDLPSDELSTLAGAQTIKNILMLSRAAPGASPHWSSWVKTVGAAMAGMVEGDLPLRRDFSPLAFFVPSVVTDARGLASVAVRVPDSLTSYRLIGVVTDGKLRFGAAHEATITARLPLMARPSPPRFLNRGDEFELPVVVQNDTDSALQTDVAVRATNLRLVEEAGRSVSVAARGRAEVRFPLAADEAGEAALAVVAKAGALADSAELKLPVKVPARVENAAVYGHTDEDGAFRQTVQAPADALTDIGGVDVTLSSTGLQALGNAVLNLATYEYECAEQISSRLLAIAVLRDVLAAFQLPGLPPAEKLASRAQLDIQGLGVLQNSDGGFGFWRRGDESWPYVTIHVTQALARARQKGFLVSPSVLSEATSYLEQIEDHIPSSYPVEARYALRAYAIYVLRLLDKPTGRDARALIGKVGLERLSLESLGWLLPSLADDGQASDEVRAIRTHLNNRVTETAGSAHFISAYPESAHLLLLSKRRTDAVLLDALIQVDPKDALIPKLASGLLDAVKHDRWLTTQDDSFILIALDRYFQTYEKTSPDFLVRLWWGERLGGSRTFRGHTFESDSLNLPMAQIKRGDPLQVTIAKQGSGRLYYRVGLRHATNRIDVPAVDNGMRVARRYLAVDDPGDVQRQADGHWRFRAGARVRIEVTLVAPAERHHVALVDPLPAGLEPLNPILALNDVDTHGRGAATEEGDGEGASSEGIDRWRLFWWFVHYDLRDDRTEVFATSLRAGVYRFDYLARATTKGRFVAPAPKAEEMYAPETYGRAVVDRVVVE